MAPPTEDAQTANYAAEQQGGPRRSGRKRRHKAACACCQATPGLPTPPQQEQDPPQQVQDDPPQVQDDPPQQGQDDQPLQVQDDPPQQGQDPSQVDNVLPQQQNALQDVPPSLTKAEQARQRRQQAKRVREQAAEDRLFEVDIHLCRVASVEADLLSLTEGEVTEGRILRGINRAVISRVFDEYSKETARRSVWKKIPGGDDILQQLEENALKTFCLILSKDEILRAKERAKAYQQEMESQTESEPDADAPLSLSAAGLMDVADPHSFSLRSPRLLPKVSTASPSGLHSLSH
ncbi:hypothetical protein ACOMHN_007403 [Nucella lapillus]